MNVGIMELVVFFYEVCVSNCFRSPDICMFKEESCQFDKMLSNLSGGSFGRGYLEDIEHGLIFVCRTYIERMPSNK